MHTPASPPEDSDTTTVERHGLDPERLKRRREELALTGINYADWAREHGFEPSTVHEVIAGRRACLRGKSHQIAVALGLKDGVPVQVAAE